MQVQSSSLCRGGSGCGRGLGDGIQKKTGLFVNWRRSHAAAERSEAEAVRSVTDFWIQTIKIRGYFKDI